MKLSGVVVRGQGFASLAFGVPTANLEFAEVVTLVPGSYAAVVTVAGSRYQAVAYSGTQGSEKFEVHLFGFTGELYGQTLEVEVLQLLSPHVAWENEAQMKAKVLADVGLARAYFSTAV